MRLFFAATFFAFVAVASGQPVENKFYSPAGKWVKTSNTNCLVWSSFPREGESVTWSGGVNNGKAFGHGTLQWSTNNISTTAYEGELKDGRADGHGIAKSIAETYEGEWKEGRLVSTNITIKYGNGNWYKGEVRGGFKTGKGEELMAGGYRYVGQFKNDRFEGAGDMILPNGDKVSGSWTNSQLDGIGTYTAKDGRNFKVHSTTRGIQRLTDN
jgi:hypothetical protein